MDMSCYGELLSLEYSTVLNCGLLPHYFVINIYNYKMSSYQSLYDQVVAVATTYSLSSLLNGFDASLINILLKNHLDKIQLCSSYDVTMQLINHTLSAHMKVPIKIDAFITVERDRQTLYDIFKEWRIKLLQEAAV